MTITVLPMDATAGAPAYSAKNARQAQAPLYGNPIGRVFGTRSGWRVGTLSSIVSVTSTTWTLNPCSCMIEPQALLYQGTYGWATDAVITGGVTAADAANPRLDILYIQVNDSSAGDGSGALSAPLSYLAGTAAGTPVAPTLPARSFLVGTISMPKVGAGSPTITLNPQYFVAAGGVLPVAAQADRDSLTPYESLTVYRKDLGWIERWTGTEWVGPVRHAEYTFPVVSVPNNTAWGPGTGTVDTTRSLYPAFVTNPANDVLAVTYTGLYSISWYLIINGATAGPVFFALDRSGHIMGQQYPSAFEHTMPMPNIYLLAGEQIKFVFVHTVGAAVTVTHRIRITKVG